MIPVYVANSHKVTLEDSAWQVVECEHCNLEWAFRIRLGGIGVGESPYFLDEKGAQGRAAERAHRALELDRQLAREGVMRNVACPGCSRFQNEMVESLRRTHGSSLAASGAACMVLGTLLALRALTESELLARSSLGWTVPSAVFLVAGALLLARRSQLRRRFDPNAEAGGLTTTSPAQGPDVMTRAQYDSSAPTDRPPIAWRRP